MASNSANGDSHASHLTAEGVPNSADNYIFNNGTDLWKVRAFNKWYRRKYFLNVEKQQIIYQGSQKFGCGAVPMLTIDIADINEIRKGWATDMFNKVSDHVQKQISRHPERKPLLEENVCFSILYGRPSQTLDLVASNTLIRDSWVNELTKIIDRNRNSTYDQKKTQSLKKTFSMADKDQDKALTFDECVKLLKKDLNLKMPSKKYARELFDKANIYKTGNDKEQVLNQEEFIIFYESICKRMDLELIMMKFGNDGKALMGPEELSKFLLQEQKMQGPFLPSDCLKIIKQYEGDQSNEFTLAGFTKFMMTDKQQNLFNEEHTKVFQDMSQPVSHYFIASSHNTYLVGNQLSGESSVEGYIFALKRGCRCVELDLWDGDDGEPIIYHGHTFVSKIKLEDVLTDGIKPYAFKDSQYPLLLSLENHCSMEQQERVAYHLKTILGDMLYLCTPNVLREMDRLPSPENLRGKIIVKAKKLPEADDLDDVDDAGELESPPEDFEEGIDDADKKTSKAKSPPLSKDLSDVVGICRSVHFKGFEHSAQHDKCYDIVSISENKAQTLIEKHAPAFVDHTKRNLVRIYPQGTRTGSSNYKPIPMWNVGAQIVALNYQTADKPNLVNAAKFMTNGNCGYVLKPKFLLEGSFDPKNPGEHLKKTLHLRVISGQCIPRPASDKKGEVVDPYVVVKIHGHPEDKQKHQTKVIENNGFNPIWDNGTPEDTPFEIPLKLPEASFLHFIVYDSDQGRDDKLGQSIIPFCSIQEGYRHVNLVNKNGAVIDNASLFVHIVIS